MPQTFQLHSHGFNNSESLEAAARAHAQELDDIFEGIHLCRVFITAPSQHHRHGRDFDVRIEVTIPGGNICTSAAPHLPGQKADAYEALNRAFKLMRQQLQRHVRHRVRGEMKRHSEPAV